MEQFNWKVYIQNYPDLQDAGIKTQQQAWKHWNNHGKKENRTDKIIPKKSNNLFDKIIPKKSNNLFDIVIPLGPNDLLLIEDIINHCKYNILDYRNIYIISKENIIIDNCIFINENIFPFKLSDINIQKNRNNWYFQQLLKLYAGSVIQDILDNYIVIDADTYFLKPTMFIENGVFLFNTSSEYHQPYFTHMKKLHPSLIKQMNCSGICHFMMFNKECLNGLFNLVSNNNNNFDFWKVFLDCVNPQESSGASEYEIYFNYMLLYKPELIKIRNLQWANLDKYSVENYDYISIHWWTRKC